MFVIQLEDLGDLMHALYPLILVALSGDIKCSPDMLSLIVSHHSSHFIAALRLASPFFTSFDSDGDEEYRSRTSLDSAYRNLYYMDFDNLSLTIFLQEGETQAPIQFEDFTTGFFYFSSLPMLPPQGEDVGEIDYETFVAIDSEEFEHITRELSVYSNDSVWVTLTDSQVKFSVATEEIVLTAELSQCIIGGIAEGAETRFPITLNPMGFFLYASFLSNLVWLFRSTDCCSMISFPIALQANILTYYPQR